VGPAAAPAAQGGASCARGRPPSATQPPPPASGARARACAPPRHRGRPATSLPPPRLPQNTALFSLLGTTYGGNGKTTFALPDAQGRVLVGAGQGPGLTNRDLGESGGQSSVTLFTSEMPSHRHGLAATPTPTLYNAAIPAGETLGRAAFSHNHTTGTASGPAVTVNPHTHDFGMPNHTHSVTLNPFTVCVLPHARAGGRRGAAPLGAAAPGRRVWRAGGRGPLRPRPPTAASSPPPPPSHPCPPSCAGGRGRRR
jgi:microcystin-dependent protein